MCFATRPMIAQMVSLVTTIGARAAAPTDSSMPPLKSANWSSSSESLAKRTRTVLRV